MISKNQIKYVSTSACSQGEKVVSLSLLLELRQQLKNKLCTPSNHKKLKGGELICNSCEVIENVLCVEGEK